MKIINIGLVTITIVGPCVVSAATPFTATLIPMFIVNGISTNAGIAAMFSSIFNLKERKEKMNKSLMKIEEIKNKLDYVVSCNGNLTIDECNKILIDVGYQ